MTSSSLTYLRTVPQAQATIYNSYLKSSTAIRMNKYLPGDARLAQIGALVATATNALQDLLTQANTAETKVRAATSSVADATPESTQMVTWAIDHNLSLSEVCEQLVQENNRAGFSSLKSLLPWAAKAGKLIEGGLSASGGNTSGYGYDRAMQSASDTIGTFESQLFTPSERAIAAELQECAISMPIVRNNHDTICLFLTRQTLPDAVAGTFTRLESIYRWQGLPGDSQPKGLLQLGDDFGGQYKAHGITPQTPAAYDLAAYQMDQAAYRSKK